MKMRILLCFFTIIVCTVSYVLSKTPKIFVNTEKSLHLSALCGIILKERRVDKDWRNPVFVLLIGGIFIV